MAKLKKPWIGLIIGFLFGLIYGFSKEDAIDTTSIIFGGVAFSIFGLLFYSMIQLTISSVLSRKHGFLKGFYLTLNRMRKCHPWGGDGYDPVP